MVSSSGFAKQGLDFAPHHFDGIEIRGIRRQEESLSARLGNELEGLLVFVWRQVVHDDDVAWAKVWEAEIVHISLEDTGVGGPSMAIAAVVPSRRTAPRTVVVRQCPWGKAKRRRRPLGQRPRIRVMFVLAADSSRKTRREGSRPGWRRFQRRLFLATSGRPCSLAWSVFFYMPVPCG